MGSYCDPDDIPGMAHFLEHMLFYGSKKYPEEGGYDKFVQVSGMLTRSGSTNRLGTVIVPPALQHLMNIGSEPFTELVCQVHSRCSPT